jgi:hypothetical protein
MDPNDPADARVLLKKLWCHGQAIAPVQGVAYAFWAVARDSKLSTFFRLILWIAALKFPVWGYVSFRALHLHNGDNSFKILSLFGIGIILIDIFIIILAVLSGELGSGWTLLACIATTLHAIETTAFLSAVSMFRGALKAYDAVEDNL